MLICWVLSRFLFLLLGPFGKGPQYHEIGRSIATLMTDEVSQAEAGSQRGPPLDPGLKYRSSVRFSTMSPTKRGTGTTCCRGSMSSWIRSPFFLQANGTPASASSPPRASRPR